MILFKTKFLNLKAAKRAGKPDWYYVSRVNAKNIVVVLPIIENKNEDEILFLITKRPPLEHENIAKYSIETVAGLVGDENENETLEAACYKELLEESGMEAYKFELCAKKVSTSGGLTDEVCAIYKAYINNDKIVKKPVDDGGVIIDRVKVKKSEIRAFLNKKEEEGYAISAQMLAALFYL